MIAFNLASLAAPWRDRWTRTELIGWVPPSRWPRALRLPLEWWGLRFEQLLFYGALVGLDLAPAWRRVRREQVRAGRGVEQLRRWLEGDDDPRSDGLPRRRGAAATEVADRVDAEFLRVLYADALAGVAADHPVLRLLAAALDELGAAGLSVLVYLVPANAERLEAAGLAPAAGFARSAATLRRLVEARGARFLDLHRLLPDTAFRDAVGHLTHEPPLDATRRVARRLADALREPSGGERAPARPPAP